MMSRRVQSSSSVFVVLGEALAYLPPNRDLALVILYQHMNVTESETFAYLPLGLMRCNEQAQNNACVWE